MDDLLVKEMENDLKVLEIEIKELKMTLENMEELSEFYQNRLKQME